MTKLSLSKMVMVAAGVVALTSAAMPASAQVTRMRTSIPFAFTAGDSTLPAGNYSVEVNAWTRIMHIYPANSTHTVSVLLSPSTDKRSAEAVSNGLLRFEKIGDQFVLNAVWRPDQNLGNKLNLPKSLAELQRSDSGAPVIVDLQLK